MSSTFIIRNNDNFVHKKHDNNKFKSYLEKNRFSKLLYRNDKIDFIEYTVNVRLAKLSKLQYISSRV